MFEARTTGRQRKSCQTTGSRHQGLLADCTVLPVPGSLVKRVNELFGEKRRSIYGTVIDTDQFVQPKTGGWIAYL